ncbi:SHOCT domain-containing protein [Niveibacterium sp.]|uniref:SHOCT domain-containing protein n=1 Tax=Niveibacterium sp. TaxID=2017444 RepID=UPI0035AF2669
MRIPSTQTAHAAAVVVLTLLTPSAHATVLFSPEATAGAVTDLVLGERFNACGAPMAKVGDTFSSIFGHRATVREILSSGDCKQTQAPIPIIVEVTEVGLRSKVEVDLPEPFEAVKRDGYQRFGAGLLLAAVSKSDKISLQVYTRAKDGKQSLAEVTRSIQLRMSGLTKKAKISDEEHLTINGHNAERFVLTASNPGLFGRSFTYVGTVIEGDSEIVSLTANIPEDSFPAKREMMIALANGISWKAPAGTVGTPSAPAAKMQNSAVPNATTASAKPGPADFDPDLLDASMPAGGKPGAAAPTALTAAKPTSTGSPSKTASTPAARPADAKNEGTADNTSVSSRLRQLDALFKEGVITQKEYEEKKRELLRLL